ncbi:nucleotide sugar dehydrogenase [Brevibacillus fluminis]|uniref:nucleotide sugar dehydrogenase n=1 Tax=Brevibacillus fluminis TaxID=511487 RepID=UPI003F8BD6B2
MTVQHDTVAIIGLGYVGLPLALLMGSKGCDVLGIDKDQKKIDLLAKKTSYIPDVSSAELAALMEQQLFSASLPTDAIKKADTIIVTVPTPVTEHDRKPDLSALISATEYICTHLRKGQTVIYESSTFPGTLEDVILPILLKAGLQLGVDFYLGYSPERIDPGNTQYRLEQIPKVVSGQTVHCLQKVASFYGRIFDTIVPVSSPKVAEMTKIFENVQRLVNISLVNEIHLICRHMNIDFREALAAAASKPFGFTMYTPGPGIGGHCIPVDPLYFQWKAKEFGLFSTLIEEADKINRSMPAEIVKQVKAVAEHSSVLLIGLAYKRDVNDVRESPALEIYRLLLKEGIQVSYHDPYVASVAIEDQNHNSRPLTDDLIRKADVVIILTDHSVIDWQMVQKHAKYVIDTRGILNAKESDTP